MSTPVPADTGKVFFGWDNSISAPNVWTYYPEPTLASGQYTILVDTKAEAIAFYATPTTTAAVSEVYPKGMTIEEMQAWAIATWRMM